MKIKGYKYKKISAILELKHNDMEENDLVNYNVMSYYLVNPLFDNCCLRDLMDEPYCIVSFLRGNLFETTINKIIDSKIFDNSDDIKFQIYNQLNGLDYVLILGSNKLTSLMKFITSIRDLIYCKKNDNDKTETVILDSFSIIGMKKDKICNNTEIIPRISIHAKMKDMKKKNSMIKDLSIIENNNNLKIQKYYNIGHSDFIFTFFNVEINKFITVYDDFFKKNMNLNNNYFTFLDTKFSIEVNNQNKQNHVEISEDEFDVIHQQETKNKYLEKISDLNEELYHCKELIASYGDIYYYNILNILEIISNIEKNKQYCISYDDILDSLILFIGKIKEFHTMENKEMKDIIVYIIK